MVFKKDLTPIGGKGGQVVKHAGKGHATRPPAFGPNSNPMATSINDYAKATPMAKPGAPPQPPEIE